MKANRFRFRAWEPAKGMMTNPLDTYFGMSRFFGFIGDGAILMQSTGLMDKNGVEIFEGDIVAGVYVVRWVEALGYDGCGACHPGFYLEARWNRRRGIAPELEWSLDLNTDDIEVIGNIYENQELLGAE